MCTKLHKATQPTLQRGRRRSRAALSVGLIPGLTWRWRWRWLWLWLQSLCRDHVSSHSALPPPSASATERSSKRIYHHCRLPNFSSISDPPFSLTPPPQPFAPFDYDKPSIAPAADHESPSVHDDVHLTGTASNTITIPSRAKSTTYHNHGGQIHRPPPSRVLNDRHRRQLRYHQERPQRCRRKPRLRGRWFHIPQESYMVARNHNHGHRRDL